MYNLLMAGAEGYWDAGAAVIDLNRYLEYTDDALRKRLKPITEAAISELKCWPALFAYEKITDLPARVGSIKTIKRRGDELRISFALDPTIRPIPGEEMRTLWRKLDIEEKWEVNRSHWAVKDIDLFEVLEEAGLLKEGQRPLRYRFSRSTLLKACDILQTLGHTEFDRFLLELGIDEIDAGRSRGGLLARSVALSEYVVMRPEQLTAEGEPLALAVVRRAAEADPNYPEGHLPGVKDTSRRNFWTKVRQDGYQLLDGRIVPIGDFSAPVPPARPNEPGEEMRSVANSRKVFIVHGRDSGPKYEIAEFLRRIGLEPIILHDRPNRGRTLISKFREEADGVGFAVVLMTPDDCGGLKNGPKKARARQNVVFELGFFIGKLGAERVCALVEGDLEKPSDFDAVVYIEYGERTPWRIDLARELTHAGIQFDHAKVFS